MMVTLIYPAMGCKDDKPFVPLSRMEPLALGILAGLTPPEVGIAFWDDRFEPIPFDRPTDLVGISVDTFSAKRSYQIAQEYRSRGVPVILGGYHPTVLPDEALEHADAVLVGEAEGLWPRVLEDASHGRLNRIYRQGAQPSLQGIRARRAIFQGKGYLDVALVNFSRGCRQACNFCAVSVFYRPSFNVRPAEDVAEEVAALRERFIFFVDDNIAGDLPAAKKLFRLIAPLKVRWAGQISVNFLHNLELLDLMADSGCRGLLIGFESLSDDALRDMNKSCNRRGGYDQVLSEIRKRGIMVWGSFLLGYDHDDESVFDRTVAFTIKNNLCLAAFNHLTPYPGTPLYDRLRSDGRLQYDKWWLDPDYRFGTVPFLPARMSPQQLARGCEMMRKRFNSVASILHRGLDFKANLRNPANALFFLAANRISRTEARKKKRLEFGLTPALKTGGPRSSGRTRRKRP